MNAAQHLAAAERYASLASHVRSTVDITPINPAESAHCIAMAHLHLDFARTVDVALRSVDTRRDPDDVEWGSGWPPQHGDVWRDGEGQTWVMGADQLTCLNDGTVADPAGFGPRAQVMRLVYRPYVPSDADMEPPF